MRTRRLVHPSLTSAALAALLTQLPAQDAQPAAEKITAWPRVSKEVEEEVAKTCQELRHAKQPAVFEKLEARLAEKGADIAPLLLDRLSDKEPNINPSLQRVLDRIVDARYATPLAAHAKDKRLAVRSHVITRLTDFALPESTPVFEAARKDKDLSFQAALGLASVNRLDGLDEIFARAREDWAGLGPRISTALAHARGINGAAAILSKIQTGDERTIVTGLRLLRSLAPKEMTSPIVPFLDHEFSGVKKEAINTLRVLVDGAEPLEDLSAFQAIEMANAWKKRLS